MCTYSLRGFARFLTWLPTSVAVAMAIALSASRDSAPDREHVVRPARAGLHRLDSAPLHAHEDEAPEPSLIGDGGDPEADGSGTRIRPHAGNGAVLLVAAWNPALPSVAADVLGADDAPPSGASNLIPPGRAPPTV